MQLLLARPACAQCGASLQPELCPMPRSVCSTCSKTALVCNQLLQHSIACPSQALLCQPFRAKQERGLTCSTAAFLCQQPPSRCHPAVRWTLQDSLLQPAVPLRGAPTEGVLPQGAALCLAGQKRAGLGGLQGLQNK